MSQHVISKSLYNWYTCMWFMTIIKKILSQLLPIFVRKLGDATYHTCNRTRKDLKRNKDASGDVDASPGSEDKWLSVPNSKKLFEPLFFMYTCVKISLMWIPFDNSHDAQYARNYGSVATRIYATRHGGGYVVLCDPSLMTTRWCVDVATRTFEP